MQFLTARTLLSIFVAKLDFICLPTSSAKCKQHSSHAAISVYIILVQKTILLQYHRFYTTSRRTISLQYAFRYVSLEIPLGDGVFAFLDSKGEIFLMIFVFFFIDYIFVVFVKKWIFSF